MDDTRRQIAEQLTVMSDRSGMTREAFAEAIGCPRSMLQRYLSGKHVPSVRVALRFCKAGGATDDMVRDLMDMMSDSGHEGADALRMGLHSDCWGDLLEVTP